MRKTYLKYYAGVSPIALFKFSIDLAFTKEKVRRLSLRNRIKDYASISDSSELMQLHQILNEYLIKSQQHIDSYDYGQGYFYQSCNPICITGLRDTEARLHALKLRRIVEGRSVLDIGCNSGFLANELAKVAKFITCLDFNPFLIACTNKVAEYLGNNNLKTLNTPFEDFDDGQYDVVLSLANHSTYDGNTRQSIEQYFQRCQRLLKPGGTLVFESHPPEYEGNGLERVCKLIEDSFDIQYRSVLEYGTFLDRGRTTIVANR